jgi:hypothetical protein
VQRHAYPQQSGLRPWFIRQSALGRNRGGKDISGGEEGRLYRIADVFVVVPL